MMNVFKSKERLAQIVTVFLSVLIMEVCATAIKYSHDTKKLLSTEELCVGPVTCHVQEILPA